MNFIGNILTEKKFDGEGLYNVVSDKNNLIGGIPTLCIGWEFTKKMYDNANILEWEIGNGVYWTFGSREKRDKYEKNLEKFKSEAVSSFIKGVKYIFFNVLTTSDDEKREFIEKMASTEHKNVFVNGDIAYICCENEIYGISMRDIEYEGQERGKFLSRILKNGEKIEILGKDMPWEIKNLFKDKNYALAKLCS